MRPRAHGRPGQRSRLAEFLSTRPVVRGGTGLLATALAAAGCGGSDKPASTQPSTTTQPLSLEGDQRGVLETIDALQTAAGEDESAKICADLFTAKLRRSIEAASKRSCASEVRTRLFDPKTSISVQRDFQVDGAKATAVIRDQSGRSSTLHLVRQGDVWRIDRLTPGSS
jgi:hypothetical protein